MHPSLMEKIAQGRQLELRERPAQTARVWWPFNLKERLGWLMIVVGLRLALRSALRRGALVS